MTELPGLPTPATPDGLGAVLEAFSIGELEAAEAALAARSPADPLVAELAAADIANRRVEAPLPDLVALRDRIDAVAAADDVRRAWAAALVADRLVLDGDPEAAAVVGVALDAFPHRPLTAPVNAYVRARLLWLAAGIALFFPLAEALDEHRRYRDDAVHLLLRYGFRTEAVVAGAVLAGFRVFTHADEPHGAHHRLVEAHATLAPTPTSVWHAAVDTALTSVALHRRDAATAAEVYARIEGSPVHHPRTSVHVVYGRAAFRVLAEGPTRGAVANLEAALAYCRGDARWHYGATRHAAHLLLELGSPAGPRLSRASLVLPATGPVDEVERTILRARIAIAEGDPPEAATLWSALDRLEDWGRPRVAARFALHLAHDLVRDGSPEARDAAGDLHRWGVGRLPPPAGRTTEEEALCRPPGAPRPHDGAPRAAGAPAATLVVNVLRPDPDVRVNGDVVALAPMASLLLLTLVAHHPGGLHVEAAHEALWPGAPFERDRLNTLVHRLRTRLGPAADAVRRTRNTIALDPDHVLVDLDGYREALRLGGPDAARALAAVRGHLWSAAHPYDEHLGAARRAFAQEWVAAARRLVGEGAVDRAALLDAAVALELDPAVLD